MSGAWRNEIGCDDCGRDREPSAIEKAAMAFAETIKNVAEQGDGERIITIGPGFFVPLAAQFRRNDVPPAICFPIPAGAILDFRPQVVAYPGDRAGLHAALDQWLDAPDSSVYLDHPEAVEG